MATTTSEPTPIRPRVLVLDETKLRAQLLEHLVRAATAARSGAAHPDLATGVHDVRKAARRVRAVADLARETISRRERRHVHDAIRQARHILGPARDHDVAAHLLATLELEEPAREAAKLVLQATSFDAPSSSATRQAVVESADIVVKQSEALQNALTEALTFETLVEGLKRTYARARRARKAAKRSKRAFHTWRRRTKELGYQLDVLGDAAGPRLIELTEALRDISHAQRDAVDLLMIRTFVRSHRDVIDPDAYATLDDALTGAIGPAVAEVRRTGKAGFRKKPRQLARSACRDVTTGATLS